ncbi:MULTISPECIES: VanZ family protein [unclassified Pseudonocardia]|uniref:VanZ family protein n=1 Tax=unclassified Pseudonocardia TaxID=2619320 RepID=UPI00095F068E|nr:MULTISPECIES: VanZ family protein [unclassified Pseudonocardia]MBN9098035.1 VanZ family protein [Pseudonocardia sp.]OJY54431.1 MAG: hypothetical protein BGP03_23145 [Pseudonocardia sp. 73-21]
MPPRLFVAHVDAFGVVPLTWWAALILVCGLVLTAAVVRPFTAVTGWRPIPTAATGVWLAVTAALTLGPGNLSPDERAGCAVPDDSTADVLIELGHSLEGALNAVLLLPLGVTLVLASRRALVPGAVVVVLPGLVELAQLFVPGRFCSLTDFVLNAAGGLVGVGFGVGAVLLRQSRRDT